MAFLHEGGGQRGFEGDDERAAGSDGHAGLRGALDQDVGGIERDGFAIEFERDLAAVQQRRDLRGGEGGDGADGLFHEAAELGAEGLVVGLGGEFRQRGFVAAEADFLDVELVGDDVRQRADEVEEGFVAADDVERGEGLADLEVEVGAELAGEADDFLDLGHLGLEGFVAGEAAGQREVAEVHGLGHARRAQVAVDLF